MSTEKIGSVAAVVELLDLVIAVDTFLMNREQAQAKYKPTRDRVVEIYLASKDRDLTKAETKELTMLRNTLIDARRALVQGIIDS